MSGAGEVLYGAGSRYMGQGSCCMVWGGCYLGHAVRIAQEMLRIILRLPDDDRVYRPLRFSKGRTLRALKARVHESN